MIVIIADDFSGAAELAGIAAARGFKSEVQTCFDPTSDAEVIAVDTDTRLQPEDDAVHCVAEITRRIVATEPAWIYKKTDSVMRGNIRAEIETILDVADLDHCVLIPANPSKGRVIRHGHYFVDSVPLHETVFASDPDFPCRTSCLRELVGASPRIQTPDASSLDDLQLNPGPRTLAAGAADFFSARIGPGKPVRHLAANSRTLLLCGSLAAWDTGRPAQMEQRGFIVKTLADTVSHSIWRETSKLMLAIGRPDQAANARLTERLVEQALPLLADAPTGLRIGLEGGATAMALIRRMGWSRFEVIPEGHVGVGSLLPPGGPLLCVKPGSYPWPEDCL